MDTVSDIENWVKALTAEFDRFASSASSADRTLDQEKDYFKSIRKLIKRLNEDLDDHCYEVGGKALVELDAIFTKRALNNYLKASEAIGIAPIGIQP
jgi:hypothetical protein